MRKVTEWKKIAENQFYSMPKDYQDDWRDLRNFIIQHR